MRREPEMVHNLTSNRVHLARVEKRHPAIQFGASYTMPDASTVALCGVKIDHGVVMDSATKVNCGPCKHIASTGG